MRTGSGTTGTTGTAPGKHWRSNGERWRWSMGASPEAVVHQCCLMRSDVQALFTTDRASEAMLTVAEERDTVGRRGTRTPGSAGAGG